VVIAIEFSRECVRMNVCELKVEPAFAHPGGKNFPGGGQSAVRGGRTRGARATIEQRINGSPDKH
jgi:hypothetical protein